MIVDIQTSNQQEQKGKKDNETINNHFSRILKQKDMYCTNTTTTIFIHTIQAQKSTTKKGTIYTIWFCVQRRKAFELAAAYLQIIKGTKDTDNNFNYYIKNYFLKCRETKLDMTTKWICYGRLKLRLICEEMIFTPLLKATSRECYQFCRHCFP